jgi:hypothetical protein
VSDSSPIRAGFTAVRENPAIAAIEIAWRWTFGFVSTILLLLGAKAFLAGLKLTDGDEQALRGNNPTVIAAALMHVLQQGGVLQRFFAIVVAVAIPSVIIWVGAATIGRAAVLRKLMPTAAVNTRVILGLNIARAGLLFAALVAWYVWMVLCALITMTSEPNYPLYILLSTLALPVIAIVWGLLNWILSLAPVLAVSQAGRARKVYAETVRTVRRQQGKYASVGTWLGLPRLAGMVIAFIAAIIVLVATDSVLVGTIAITVISLAYCAFADYLYVVRLAAYARIARELPIATAAPSP